jgi:DNA gyrase subunit A
MSQFSVQLLNDLEKESVEWMPNYDGSRVEPLVLPAAFPNLLCNGSEGIAVGMATKIPPHNLREVIDACIYQIDNPDCTLDDLMKYIKGPDFPTAGLILGTKGIRQAYETGHGSVIMQGKTNIEDAEGGKSLLVITELPYQVNKARLIEQIADLHKQKKVEGILGVDDYSDRTGMRVVITLRRDAYPKKVLNVLLKHTPLRTTFGVNMLALVTGQPRLLTLKEAIRFYINHRRDVVRRRTVHELNVAKARAHRLEGLILALDVIDEIITLIRASRNAEVARNTMVDRFGFTHIQADAILAMQLRQLAALERQRLEIEYKDLLKLIAYLEDILASSVRLDAIVKQELKALRDRFADERRTRIIPMEANEIGDEDMIPEEEMIVSITRDGYIKRVPKDTYPTQKRGGRGRKGAATKEEDSIEHLFIATTHDFILFFTDRGRVYRLKAYEVPLTSRQAMGTAVINLINILPGEKITATVPMKTIKHDGYLLFVTEQGEVKRTAMHDFQNLRASGLICFDIEAKDALRWVAHTTGEDEIILVTAKAMSIRFAESDVPVRGRPAGGVRGIRLSEEKGDRVVGMGVVNTVSDLLVIGEYGIGKRTPLKDYRAQGRAGMGVRTMAQTERTGDIVDAAVVDDNVRLLIMSRNGIAIQFDVSDIRSTGRSTQGVRVINLDDGDSVSSVERVSFDTNIEA